MSATAGADQRDAGGVAGPWVLVLGMHRSGTSALAGALGGLGLDLPPDEDLIEGKFDNPNHYESDSLVTVNNAILEALGGAWNGPPLLEPGWEIEGGGDVLPRARSTLAAVFPGPGPKVWKDPRNCLLLPYWRRLLTGPTVAILVWRSPLAAARSLARRDGMTLPLGLALWERYNRSALLAARGLPTFVVDHRRLMADPRSTLASVADWLDTVGIHLEGPEHGDVDRAASVVAPELSTSSGDGDLLPEQRGLCDLLASLDGPHAAFPDLELPPVSAWSTDLLVGRHRFDRSQVELGRLGAALLEVSTAHQGLIEEHRRVLELNAGQTVRLEALEQALTQTSEEIDALHVRLEAMTGDRDAWKVRSLRVTDELDRMWSSTSWKVTGPLRSVIDVLRQRSGRPDGPVSGR